LVAAGAEVAGITPKAKTPAMTVPITLLTKRSSHTNLESSHRV
jgi:hypothetical protein